MSIRKAILELPLIGKVRRVHAIEHATITLLSRRHPRVSMAGRSNARGFWFYGNIDEEELGRATREALSRLQGGESGLAIHPNCGTNMAVAGILTGAASFLASLPWHTNERMIDRLPRAIIAATVASIFAKPAGLAVQKGYTTSPEVAGLSVGRVSRKKQGKIPLSFVEILG